jgi:hypothetical protein
MPIRAIIIWIVAFLVSVHCVVEAGAAEGGHLVRIRDDFNTAGAPYAKTYARLCEEMLFTGSNWIIRYYRGSETGETGVSITREQDGRFWVTAKYIRAQLTAMLMLEDSRDLKSDLKAIKVLKARTEIPERLASAISDSLTSLLGDVRPEERNYSGHWFLDEVQVYAKTKGGTILRGKLPPDTRKYRNLTAVNEMYFDLVELCLTPQANHKSLFDRIERRARTIRD